MGKVLGSEWVFICVHACSTPWYLQQNTIHHTTSSHNTSIFIYIRRANTVTERYMKCSSYRTYATGLVPVSHWGSESFSISCSSESCVIWCVLRWIQRRRRSRCWSSPSVVFTVVPFYHLQCVCCCYNTINNRQKIYKFIIKISTLVY